MYPFRNSASRRKTQRTFLLPEGSPRRSRISNLNGVRVNIFSLVYYQAVANVLKGGAPRGGRTWSTSRRLWSHGGEARVSKSKFVTWDQSRDLEYSWPFLFDVLTPIVLTSVVGCVRMQQRLVTSSGFPQFRKGAVLQGPGSAFFFRRSGEVDNLHRGSRRDAIRSGFPFSFPKNPPLALGHNALRAEFAALWGHLLSEVPRRYQTAAAQTASPLTPLIGSTSLIPQLLQVWG